ncbi:MAG: type II secretion system secretin GspD [Deltaproteobacteria bacterium]
MQGKLIFSSFLIFVLVGLAGCAASGKNDKTFVDLSEINSKIQRTGQTSEVLEKETGAQQKGEEQPAKKVFPVGKGATNEYLRSFVPSEPAVPKALAGEGILLNFDNADIYEVIQSIGEILDINYIIDPQVKGTVNIRSGKKIPLDQLYPIFKKILEINGLDIRSEGDYQYIYVAQHPVSQLIRGPEKIRSLKESPRMVMQIVPIEHIPSAEAVKLVEPFLSDHGQVYNMQVQNLLIITDFESKVLDCVNLLAKLDVSPMASLKVEMVKVSNAPLFDLKDDLDEIMKTLHINQNDFQGVTIMPLERVNSLLLVGNNQFMLDTAETWVHQLDVMPSEGRDNIYIYNVRNSVASELSDLVSSLISEKGEAPRTVNKPTAAPPATTKQQPGMAPGVGTTPVTTHTASRRSGSTTPSSAMQFAGEPILIPDDSRNVILIRALPPDYSRIQKLLERLDNMPRQVLIEVMVAEVTLSNDWSLGVEWYIKNRSLSVNGNEGNQNFFGRFLSNTQESKSDLTPDTYFGGFSYNFLSNSENIFAMLNVLASNNDLSVLSSPQVLVLNNETATINVGDQVPIVTSQFTDTTGSTTSNQTIQYKDTGIILNVTPRINYDGIILIDIDQQVSSVNETIKTGVNSPTISTKEVKTKLAVKNSQSILIGGLISHDRTNSESGIPLIKDLPVLGNLFKYQQEINNKKELLIMITPYVIENENVLDQYIEQFKQKTNELRHEIYGSTPQKSAAKSE